MHLSQLLRIFRLSPPLLATRQGFSDYPACAQICILNLISSTNCITNDDTGVSENLCLCKDIAYLSAVAKCTYDECGISILEDTAHVSVSNCALTETPSALTVQQMIDAGLPTESSSKAASIPTADAATAAASQTSQAQGIVINGDCNNVDTSSGGENSVDCNKSGGRSQSDKIALGMGIGFGIPTLFIAIWGLWYARIRYTKEQKDKKVMRAETMQNDTISRTGHSQYNGIELEAGVRPMPELESMV